MERTGSEEVADESSTVAREAVPHRANGGGASVVVLRDEVCPSTDFFFIKGAFKTFFFYA